MNIGILIGVSLNPKPRNPIYGDSIGIITSKVPGRRWAWRRMPEATDWCLRASRG